MMKRNWNVIAKIVGGHLRQGVQAEEPIGHELEISIYSVKDSQWFVSTKASVCRQ
jgi:hypothetical protein